MYNCRARKGSLIDELFGGSPFRDLDELYEKGTEGSYSVSVSQTAQGTKVYAKVGKDTDINALRRQLQQQYPDAQIEIEVGRHLIREISSKPAEENDQDRS